MKLTQDELDFLSAWAREEQEPACYHLPCHRLQLTHRVPGGRLLVFIKAWTESEGKKDLQILSATAQQQPRWPWSTTEEFEARFREADEVCAPARQSDRNSTSVQVAQPRRG
jgi:hypothetical protein